MAKEPTISEVTEAMKVILGHLQAANSELAAGNITGTLAPDWLVQHMDACREMVSEYYGEPPEDYESALAWLSHVLSANERLAMATGIAIGQNGWSYTK